MQMNTNHTGKFTMLRAMSPYLVTMFTSLKSCRPPCTWLSPITMLQREMPYFITPEMWPSNLPDLNPVDYSICMGYPSRDGLPFADPWCEGVERTSAERVEAAGSHHHHGQRLRTQWPSRLNTCVNGGHFQHKFWASDFLLCFACVIDTGCPKCDRYKHV